MIPNQSQVLAQVKLALVAIAAISGALGYAGVGQKITAMSDSLLILLGVILYFGTALWSLQSRRAAGIVKSAEALPSVVKIVTTDQSIADQTGPKVTTP